MKHAFDIFRCCMVRKLERRLSVQTLYRILTPLAFMRAALTTAFKNFLPCAPLPECLQAAWSARLNQRQRMNGYLNQTLDYFPDQLAGPKWQGRCRINGLNRAQQAQQSGRPVVLAFVHFGPCLSIREWLRGAGIPAATLRSGKVENRPRIRKHLDKYIPFPQISTAFSLDQLREVSAFLAAGNQLCIAIDVPYSEGKQMDVPFCEDWTFRMATGAVRLAARQHAELIPCVIVDEGDWHFRLELGRPVPKEFLATEADWPQAGKHLLNEMMPHLQAHPEQCHRDLILCLRKNSPSFALS
jgi:lauroyl/myristoyl acyltransferase